jgi:hypothetical protein
MTDTEGLGGWTSPADGGSWPGKARSIATWMVTAIEAWRSLEAANDGKGADGSADYFDRLTLSADLRPGEIGQTALLMAGGATEMLRGLAAMYHSHEKFALARAHLPVFRSLQEHCGRSLWLLNPGTEFGPTFGVRPDDAAHSEWVAAYKERATRMRQLNEELLDDRLAAARKNGDTAAVRQLGLDGALTAKKRQSTRKAQGDPPFQGYSAFADLAEDSTQKLHLHLPERTRAPYGRVSETSHGTLLGLLSDSVPLSDGRRSFTSDEQDLEAVAARAGRWWITMVAMCGVYFGWDWEPVFQPFDEVQRVLFP